MYGIETSLPLIGEGLSYNETFDYLSGSTNSAKGLELINQSIYLILTTPVGSRFFLPEYGSKLDTLVFEPNDFILHDLLNIYIREALGTWEKRIIVLDVSPKAKSANDLENNVLPVEITYRLVNSNITGNYVYPFTRESYKIGGNYE